MDCGKKFGTNSSATLLFYIPTLRCRKRFVSIATINRSRKKEIWMIIMFFLPKFRLNRESRSEYAGGGKKQQQNIYRIFCSYLYKSNSKKLQLREARFSKRFAI